MPASNLLIYTNVPKVDDETVCPVCTDKAADGEVHHPHYGAICCYGCKAFFRRANQRARQNNFKCKRDGKCVIFPKCKQHCKKCRYDKCLAVGMDPKWVLTNEEKRVRFKNYFKKKDELTTEPSSVTNELSGGGPIKRRRNRGQRLKPTEPSLPDRQSSSPRPSTSRRTSGSSPPAAPPPPSHVTPTILEQRVNSAMLELQKLKSIFQRNRTGSPDSHEVRQLDAAHQLLLLQQHQMLQQQGRLSPPEVVDPRQFVSVRHAVSPLLLDDNSSSQGESYQPVNLTRPRPQAITPQTQAILSQYAASWAGSQNDAARPKGLDQKLLLASAHRNSVGQQRSENVEGLLEGSDSSHTKSVKTEPAAEVDEEEEEPILRQSSPDDDDDNAADEYPDKHRGGRFFATQAYQLSTILDAFTIISGKLSMDSKPAQDFILSHQYQKPMEKATLMSQLSMIAATLTEFAATQFLFQSLCKEDQATLLKNNIPLYLQYILARYFSAESGLEQLSWILEGQLCSDFVKTASSLKTIRLKEYNTSVDLFPTSEMVEVYSHYVDNIGMFYPFPHHCNGLVANMLLYHVDENIAGKLREERRISCIYEESKDLVKLGYDHLDGKVSFNPATNIGPLIHTLAKMKNIFGNCRVSRSGEMVFRSIPQMLTVSFTDTEESWMRNRFDLFQSAYMSVSPSKDLMDDVLKLLQRNEPISDRFIPAWMEMTSERLLRVLKTQQEFASLPSALQDAIFKKNYQAATAVAAVQMDHLKSGKDQVKHFIGNLNPQDRSWEEDFRNVIDLDELHCSALHRPEMNLGKWDSLSLKCYFEITQDIAKMCLNDHIFQLFSLLIMLDIDGLPYAPFFSQMLTLRQIYLKFIQRKMTSAGYSFGDYAHFRRTLQKVKMFANLLENFVD